MAHKLKLVYYDDYGRASSIRVALAIAGVDYEVGAVGAQLGTIIICIAANNDRRLKSKLNQLVVIELASSSDATAV